jgi:cobalt-zinc-cadmium resistance protein CzcA
MELFTGTNRGLGYRQNGFQISVAIPLLFSGNTSKGKQLSWSNKAGRSDAQRPRDTNGKFLYAKTG